MANISMKTPDTFELDVQAIQCTLEALDFVRAAFEQRSEEEGITKKQFSDWVGKDPSYVSRILNGRTSNVNYQTLARMLLALQLYPKLQASEMVDIGPLCNSKPSDLRTADYERMYSPHWKIMVAEPNDARFVPSSVESKSVSVDG